MYGNKLSKIGRKSVPEFRPRKVYCGFPGVCSYLLDIILYPTNKNNTRKSTINFTGPKFWWPKKGYCGFPGVCSYLLDIILYPTNKNKHQEIHNKLFWAEILEHSYYIQQIRTNTRKSTINFSGPKFWNTLPANLRQLVSIHQFKKKFKALLLTKYS